MSSSQLFEISKDFSYSFSLFVVWTNLLQNKTEVPFLLQLRVIGQRAGIKAFSIMVEKVILENAGIILIINYTPPVFYFTFTVYFISTEIIACMCLIYKVKYFNVMLCFSCYVHL